MEGDKGKNVWSNERWYPKPRVRMNIAIIWLYNNATDDKININQLTTYAHK